MRRIIYTRPEGIDIKRVFIQLGTTDGRVLQGESDRKKIVLMHEDFTCVSTPHERLVLFIRRVADPRFIEE